MKRASFLTLTACLAASVLACGCQSMGTVARGQNPEAPVVQTSHAHGDHLQAAVSGVQDAYAAHTNTSRAFYSDVQGASCQVSPSGAGVQYGTGASCPSGYCPSHGACPSGSCSSCNGAFGSAYNHYPRHHFSHSYERPRDLVYPPANGTGGAVVYPYYTHKGPSDFFRDD